MTFTSSIGEPSAKTKRKNKLKRSKFCIGPQKVLNIFFSIGFRCLGHMNTRGCGMPI